MLLMKKQRDCWGMVRYHYILFSLNYIVSYCSLITLLFHIWNFRTWTVYTVVGLSCVYVPCFTWGIKPMECVATWPILSLSPYSVAQIFRLNFDWKDMQVVFGSKERAHADHGRLIICQAPPAAHLRARQSAKPLCGLEQNATLC